MIFGTGSFKLAGVVYDQLNYSAVYDMNIMESIYNKSPFNGTVTQHFKGFRHKFTINFHTITEVQQNALKALVGTKPIFYPHSDNLDMYYTVNVTKFKPYHLLDNFNTADGLIIVLETVSLGSLILKAKEK